MFIMRTQKLTFYPMIFCTIHDSNQVIKKRHITDIAWRFLIKLRNNIHLENAQDYLTIQKHEKFHGVPYI